MDAELRTDDIRIIIDDEDLDGFNKKQKVCGTLSIRAAAGGAIIGKARLELVIAPTPHRYTSVSVQRNTTPPTYCVTLEDDVLMQLTEQGYLNDYHAGDRFNVALYLRTFLTHF